MEWHDGETKWTGMTGNKTDRHEEPTNNHRTTTSIQGQTTQ